MTVTDLNAALAAALAVLHEPHKEGRANAGQYGYTYLTLPDLSRVVRQAFGQHGLAFTQHPAVVDGGVQVVTRVVHTSGQTWCTEPLWMPAGQRTAQALGSAITYARRYQLAALVGLSGSDDDDAQAATQTASEEPRATTHPSRDAAPPATSTSRRGSSLAKQPPSGDKAPTEKQLKALATALGRQGWNSDESKHAQATAWAHRPIESLKDLTRSEVSDWLDELFNMPKATRVSASADGEPPFDPWADTEQEVLAT